MEDKNPTEPYEITPNYVDLQELFKKKNIKAPRFVISFLKRLLHVDEINNTLYTHRDKSGLDFIHAVIDGNGPADLDLTIEVINEANIPLEGHPIIAGNHPLGGPDGMALMGAIGRYRKDIVFPVNDFLMAIPQLRSLFVPIDKVHRNGANAQGIEKAFADPNTLLYFPAGLCSRKQKDGTIRDLEWKPTFITRAVRYQRDIIPFFFDARNRKRFYNIARWRERLGFKFNFEMALLPGEMYAQRGNHLRLIIGKPIPYSTFDNRHTSREWAALVKDYVYRLATDPNAVFEYNK